uniref:Uncharacterized protein n=1 Tax=Panagrolaimus sp. PS1159 TaxID=55785 RepID=A0AC35FXY7_9BILA
MSLLRVSSTITRLASLRSFAVSHLLLSSHNDIMEKWPVDKFNKHFIDYFNRPEIDGWEKEGMKRNRKRSVGSYEKKGRRRLCVAEKVQAEKAAKAENELARILAKIEAMEHSSLEKSLTAEKPTKDDKDGTKDTKEKDDTFESHKPVVRDAKRADEIKKHGPVDQKRKDYKTLRYDIPSKNEKEKQEAGKFFFNRFFHILLIFY